jgi:DNA-binding NarL/FixJ family response regulator
MALKILIADDHRIIREGLRALIDKENDLEVVAEAGNGKEAIQLAHAHRPDLVVMDISMPEMNGIEATRRIVAELQDIRILALSMETDRRFVVEVLKSGATGYVLKDAAFSELANAIRTVAANETYLSGRISELLIREFIQKIPEAASITYETLSSREREILQLIADGKNLKELAFTFDVSLKTIENQRHSIMKKLNLYSIAELTKYAIREGLTALN